VGKKSRKSQRGYAKILWEVRGHLHEVTGNEFMVWMCHRLHEGVGTTSYPSLGTLSKETGLHPNTISAIHTNLKTKGWLRTVDQKPSTKGRFSVPVVQCIMPWLASTAPMKPVSGQASTAPCPTVNDRRGTEVDTSEEAPRPSDAIPPVATCGNGRGYTTKGRFNTNNKKRE
jgi:hypothetical protein